MRTTPSRYYKYYNTGKRGFQDANKRFGSQKGDRGIKKCVLAGIGKFPIMGTTESERLSEKSILEVTKMALSNLFGWKKKAEQAPAAACGTACGAAAPAEKPAACGAAAPAEKPAACGAAAPAEKPAAPAEKPAACGAAAPAEKPAACGAATPAEKPAACGTACGAGDK
jgi:ACGX-repeat protein